MNPRLTGYSTAVYPSTQLLIRQNNCSRSNTNTYPCGILIGFAFNELALSYSTFNNCTGISIIGFFLQNLNVLIGFINIISCKPLNGYFDFLSSGNCYINDLIIIN